MSDLENLKRNAGIVKEEPQTMKIKVINSGYKTDMGYKDAIVIGQELGFGNRPVLRVKIKDVNMVKKHVKTTKEKKGGIFSKESFVHISNLKLVDEKIKSKKTEAKK